MTTDEEFYDASDEDTVQERKVSQGRSDKKRKDALKKIMSDPSTRIWIRHLLETCHVTSTSLSENPYNTYFLEGERNIGLRVWSEIEDVAPREFAEMMLEKI